MTPGWGWRLLVYAATLAAIGSMLFSAHVYSASQRPAIDVTARTRIAECQRDVRALAERELPVDTRTRDAIRSVANEVARVDANTNLLRRALRAIAPTIPGRERLPTRLGEWRDE